MKDMLVKNIWSTGVAVLIGSDYPAKIDSNGDFRVKDMTGRWSKYSPNKFQVLKDDDNQMALLGKKAGDKPSVTTFITEVREAYTIDDVESLMSAVTSGAMTTEELGKAFSDLKKEDARKDYVAEVTTSEATKGDVERRVSPEDLEKIKTVFGTMKDAMKPAETKTETVKETSKVKKTMTLRDILMEQGVPGSLVDDMNEYRRAHTQPDMPESINARIPKPTELYQGGALWIDCITAILAGQHILLSGGKATGKNTLTQSLAFAFQRPLWDISFHSNIGKDELVGSETFRDGNVVFNPGMAYTCAMYGGIGVLDEINMAKDNAIAVLNSILDGRRVIDVPGYERLRLHEATTFIGTMNYGYAGTHPLNEALASRFVIPDVKELDNSALLKLLLKKFPEANKATLKYFVGVFQDLQKKAHNAEISTASVDLRGILAALSMVELGMAPNRAMVSNVVNKSFEEFERNIVKDVVNTRIPESWTSADVFTSSKTIVVDLSAV
jgi:MoxR-like ATPase